MVLHCFLFSSDEEAATPIRQVLTGLGVEGESCSDAILAGDRIANQTFQIVIIDWDNQPEAGLLLTAARERKAAERPITLAIVSDDASVPKVLQAGANSILRKPISRNQAKDTLTTARDLLRAREESAAGAAQAAAAAARVYLFFIRRSCLIGLGARKGKDAAGGRVPADCPINSRRKLRHRDGRSRFSGTVGRCSDRPSERSRTRRFFCGGTEGRAASTSSAR